MDKLRDAHYFQLASQGNVYTLTSLQLANGTNKILAASLKREVYCFEYPDNTTDLLIPTTKEVLFTYIPGVVEIISIDAFNKSDTENDFVIGITITKSGNDQTQENYLNIYSAWEASPDFNLESISQNCLNVELSFIPYQLYHTNLYTWGDEGLVKHEIVWMLSGSDDKVHVYREYSVNHTYKEIELKECFPEFLNPPSIVMWMDVLYCDNGHRRISTYGCECGYVQLSIVNTKTLEIVNSYSTRYENSIATVKIFKNEPVTRSVISKTKINESNNTFHLLVGNTILPSLVFKNILEQGLSELQVLEGSDYFNITSCACIADVDLDGRNEILIGKYGQEIVAYADSGSGSGSGSGWQVCGVKSLSSAVHAMRHVDVTSDGVRELVVLTLKGLYILQHHPEDIQRKLEQKFKLLNI